MNADILDKFSTHLKNVLVRAYALAQELRQTSIEPEHLLYALISQKGSIGSEVMTKLNVTAEDLKRHIMERYPSDPEGAVQTVDSAKEASPTLSKSAKKTIEKAVLTANLHEHKYVGTEHLLSSILQVTGSSMDGLFESRGIVVKHLKEQVDNVLKSTSKFPDMTEKFDDKAGKRSGSPASPDKKGSKKKKESSKKKEKMQALEFFGVDMTDPAYALELEDVIGRDKEIERMIQVLCRKTKNNPVLLGEPGVGKTAIVEGLAKKIARGDVPPAIEGKRIISIDLGLIIAGTIYRGEFESRLKQIIDEVKANPDVILFIDELHMIMGAGAASGSLDAANILKPALARGELRSIGATTLAEYKKHIEADGALDRRFQPVLVSEPSEEEAIGILKGVRESFEGFHGVRIMDDAIEAAVQMSVRYIQDRFLPDKAIDLIDEASAMVKIAEREDPAATKEQELFDDLRDLKKEKQKAVVSEKYAEALALKDQEKTLLRKIRTMEGKQPETPVAAEVTAMDIAKVVARSTGIPVEELAYKEKRKLVHLEKELKKRIVGQDHAVRSVSDFVQRARLGLAHPNRPLASFLFLGPSGVGKTELAKVLAETVFHDKEAFVRIDMSEFGESFNVSKLLGSPAGYVGYREPTKLTDTVKRRPYSVVLFDELEKAHPDIMNIFLQIFEDGHLTDASGRKVNFKNTIIVMTSNIGSHLMKDTSLGFSGADDKSKKVDEMFQDAKLGMMQELERHFRPEFINRIDKTILFRPLGLKSLRKIVKLHIDDLNLRLADEHQMKVALSPKVAKLLAERSFQPLQGARGVRKAIQEMVENIIAEQLLSGTHEPGATLELAVKGDAVVLK